MNENKVFYDKCTECHEEKLCIELGVDLLVSAGNSACVVICLDCLKDASERLEKMFETEINRTMLGESE